jgi:hypothetical protein
MVKPRTTASLRHRANAGLPNQSASDYYRVNVFYSFVDHVVQELDTRFNNQHKGITAAQVLVPSYHHQLDSETVATMVSFYNKFVPFETSCHFEMEVAKWKKKFYSVPAEQKPTTAALAIRECSPGIFPMIHTILTIFLTIPVGSVACERSFSALRRLKLWTRSSMGQERLSGLAMLNMYHGSHFIPSPHAIYAKKADWRKFAK